MQGALEIARKLHHKNQAHIVTATNDEVKKFCQEMSRIGVINILVLGGIDRNAATRIADNEIIGSVH